MASTESMDLAQQLYVGYYGRPADPEGQAYWADIFDETDDLTGALEAFGTSEEYTENFGAMTTEELIENLYQQLFGRSAEAAGIEFYTERITSGEASLITIAKQIADGAGGDDATVLNNKISVANAYTLSVETNNADYTSDDIPMAQDLLMSVDATDESVESATSMVDDIVTTSLTDDTSDSGDDSSGTTADFTDIFTTSYDSVLQNITTSKIYYNEDGLEVKSVTEIDEGGDGTVDSSFTITSTYDGNGNAIKLVTENDNNADGTIDSIETNTLTFNASGHAESSVSETDSNADGVLDQRDTFIYTYDANNNILTLIGETDLEADGFVDSIVTYTYTYDGNNNMTSSIQEDDDDADSNIDERITITYTYDGNNNMTSSTQEEDDDADGIIDSLSTTSNTYDENGNEIYSVSTRDSDADGNIDNRTETTTTYDGNNNVVKEVMDETIMTNIAGNLITTEYQITTTYAYNADNNVIEQVIETDLDGDGAVDMRTTVTYDWDEVVVQTRADGSEYMTGTLYTDWNAEYSLDDISASDFLENFIDDVQLVAVQETVQVDSLTV
ncbi:DUF4214 domain-containing protein [Desulfobacter curvatus]|uniref:DUF4214 domain-containing protein n=1 Tax=Desulfobacter curvatus TaxID=2290 RepID=UPI00036CF869|nr:DUF4214 domain-containing protein [Desulfobacter curvatus]